MTTIAIDKDGLIAYDSRETADNLITDENCNKHHERGGVHFFISGNAHDEEVLIESFLNGPFKSYADNTSVCAIVVHEGKVFDVGIDKEEGYVCCPCRDGLSFAIGSGAKHALTAMDLGLDAKEAVKMAMKRDIYTGGRIRTFRCS